MFHRLWTLIRKELQSLLREPQTRAILIMPVLIQVLLFPFAATLEVTNATIAIYNEDNGRHAVELTQRFARAKAFTHVMLLKSPQEIRPTIDEQKRCCSSASRRTSRAISTPTSPPRSSSYWTDATRTARKSPPTISSRSSKLSAGAAGRESEAEQQRADRAQLV